MDISAATVETTHGYDVQEVRSHFPALLEGAAHFDGPGGSQVPEVVGQAVHRTLVSAISNRGRITPAERAADDTVSAARQAAADLLGADPRTVVFGRSMTALTFELSRTVAKDWRPGGEVVVSRLDHDANVRPWVLAARAAGATVRWADFDPATGELDPGQVAEAVTERTRLVAVTGASNLIGTRPDLPRIAEITHAVGALLFVDGVHLAAHTSIDLEALGADLFACSPYKFLGPHCGVLTGRLEVLESLRPDKLVPSSDEVPERFELGTLPYELLAGTTAAVDFLAGLAGSDDLAGFAGPAPAEVTRRERLVASMSALEHHEDRLRRRIEDELASLRGVTLWSRARCRTPTLLLTFADRDAQDARRFVAARGINAPAGAFYAYETSRRMGLGEAGGLRVGLAPYNDDGDVDRLLEGLRAFLR